MDYIGPYYSLCGSNPSRAFVYLFAIPNSMEAFALITSLLEQMIVNIYSVSCKGK